MSRCTLIEAVGKTGTAAIFQTFLFAFLFLFLLPLGQARAQRTNLVDGAAIVSAFSGLSSAQQGTMLDAAGISLKIFDLSSPGREADGTLVSMDELLALRAEDIGQVFAIAIDQDERPSIFIGATSLYGLYRTSDNNDWDPVMWGRSGGPGTIYRLHPDNGYQPEPLTEILSGQRENSGAGLGDIVFDARNRQLIVSNLETGMIHRVDLNTGDSVEIYDHGIDGRSYFFDANTETYEILDVAPWNEASADMSNCGAGPESRAAERFMSDPACWGYASYLRRTFALAINFDASTGDTRLYYSVWSSTPFGDPSWEPQSAEAQNTIWSVLLDESGAFDLTDVRREIIMPPFYVTRQDRTQFGESQPVASITFGEDGAMIVAERGIPLGLIADGNVNPIVAQGAGRVIKFVRDDSGKWVNDSRYDVGFGEREFDDPPHLRAAGSGGAALGYGYAPPGQIDPEKWGETVWITGNILCGPGATCGDENVDGIQGTPITSNVELAPVASFIPFPSPGPATPATGPNASYFLNFNGPGSTTLSLGDIAIVRTVGNEQFPPPIQEDVDLALFKRSDINLCRPNGICLFVIEIRNVGGEAFTGPLSISDTINANFRLDTVSPSGWSCTNVAGTYYCQIPEVSLLPGQSTEINISFFVRPGITQSRVRNCAVINWPGQSGRGQILSVQIALLHLGFDPGTPDGISGPRTRRAIREAERAYGLPRTGEISVELLDILFGTDGGVSPDHNVDNDRDCARVTVDIPPPPAHIAQISAFHRRFQSSAHNPRTSAPIQIHVPAISSFHVRYRSSMHDGATTRPIPIHRRPISRFHQTFRSNRHDGFVSSALPIHNALISTFHNRFNSVAHNILTSNQLPIHRPGISNFHQNWQSRWHARATSRHNSGLSQFHGRFNSNQHLVGTSNQGPVHLPILSTFHGRFNSNQHNLPTSRQLPVHLPRVSRAQNPPIHIPRVSRAQNPPVHIPRVSRAQNPPVHIPRVSRAQNPAPVPIPPVHLRRLSRAQNPPVHIPRVSRAQNPAPVPNPPAHLRRLSRAQNPPVHIPRVSRAQNPVPVPNPPVHRRSRSQAQQAPVPAPVAPVHRRSRSQAQQAPVPAPVAPVHRRSRSQAQQAPVPAPVAPVHQRNRSQAQQAPAPAPVAPGRVHTIPLSRQQQAPGSTLQQEGSR